MHVLTQQHFVRVASPAAVESKWDQVLALLQAKHKDKVYCFSQSGDGLPEAVSALMRQFNIVSIVDGGAPSSWPYGLQSKQYTPHAWVSSDEESESAELVRHFRGQLQHFGVKLEAAGGFDLSDVRKQHKLTFCAELPMLGLVTFIGGTGAAVVPHRVASWQTQARVLIDWQTPASLSKPDCCESQALLQLLGSLHSSQYPPLLVLTDCSNFVIYKLHGKTIKRWHTFPHEGTGYLSADDSMRLVAQFLLDASADAAFDYANLSDDRQRSEQFEIMRNVKRKLDDGEGLRAQLDVVSCLPEDERFTAAQQLVYSWAQAQPHFLFS